MIPPAKLLLKYDNPVLISKTIDKRSPTKEQPREPEKNSPLPPSLQSTSSGAVNKKSQEILNAILPPREWMEGNQLWVQQVSSAPSTRTDVIHLEEELDSQLQRRSARHTGICPVRRELYSQCFDELIRQVTTNCAERGLLMSRIRGEIQMTLAVYQTLIESSLAFGMRKALQAEASRSDMEKRISELENEKRDLMKQVDEQRARCDALEKRKDEKAQIEEKETKRNKHLEEIQGLRKAIQQYKAQLEKIMPKK